MACKFGGGNAAKRESKIKLVELGPRLRRLYKVEAGWGGMTSYIAVPRGPRRRHWGRGDGRALAADDDEAGERRRRPHADEDGGEDQDAPPPKQRKVQRPRARADGGRLAGAEALHAIGEYAGATLARRARDAVDAARWPRPGHVDVGLGRRPMNPRRGGQRGAALLRRDSLASGCRSCCRNLVDLAGLGVARSATSSPRATAPSIGNVHTSTMPCAPLK